MGHMRTHAQAAPPARELPCPKPRAPVPMPPTRAAAGPGNLDLLRIARKCASCEEEIALKGVDVSSPTDPHEIEADRQADEFIGGAARGTLASAGPSQGAATKRQPAHGGPLPPDAAPTLGALRTSGGQPMPGAVRAPFERFFQADFARVRIHDNAAAAQAARRLRAHAFARGSDLYFDRGRYDPQGSDGRRLLAHELAHTLQPGDGVARQGTPDATNQSLWDQFSSQGSRQRMGDIYEKLLSAAPGAGEAMQKRIQDTGAPKNDAEREILEARLQTLVRMNALGLMASHRATVQGRREVTMGRRRERGDTRTDKAVEKDTAQQIRGAISKVRHLRGVREELKTFRSELNGVRADSIKSLTFPVEEWFQTIADNSWKYISDSKREYLRQVAQSVGKISEKKMMRLLVFFTAKSLTEWREQQIEGTTAAIDLVYRAYPFFTQWEDFLSMPDIVQGPKDDAAMMKEVDKAFAALIDKIDDATVRIGSGGIEPFDLPVPRDNVRESLPKDLQTEFDTITKARDVAKFRNMLLAGGAQLVLVFIPVVGPALAAAVGVGMLAMSLDEMLDKAALSGASTNEQGALLGVSGPKDYEWAMLAIEAALTIADLGAVVKQFRSGGTMAHAADDLLPRWQAAAKKERNLLAEAGEINDGSKLRLDHLQAEHDVVRRSHPQPSTMEGYGVEVDVGNGHFWRRRKSDGTWCRFSPLPPSLCGTEISGLGAKAQPEALPREVGQNDIAAMRKQFKNLGQQDTLAVGYCDVPGMEDLPFYGASRQIRAKADLPTPTPHAQSPRQNTAFVDHAEQDIVNAFIDAANKRGIGADAMEGKALRIHISHPKGVCSACAQGVGGGAVVDPGVLQQLKQRYPGLTIRVTWNKADGSPGHLIVD